MSDRHPTPDKPLESFAKFHGWCKKRESMCTALSSCSKCAWDAARAYPEQRIEKMKEQRKKAVDVLSLNNGSTRPMEWHKPDCHCDRCLLEKAKKILSEEV